jgi:hypothetical protein
LALETLLLIGLLAVNVLYLMLHTPLVWFFIKLRRRLEAFLPQMEGIFSAWTQPNTEEKVNARRQFFGEVAHGVMRALSERTGSLKGVAAKQQNAGLLETALAGNAAGLINLPGKIDLPVVGKVTIGEALQLFNALKAATSGGGINLAALTGQTQGTGNTQIK